jgi:NAD(P)-dependent dehydrogenase (short-subunit alcohol dehydrogenase family)
VTRFAVRICVIDGQGGGIGAAVIKRLKEVYQEEHEIIALGTNAIATAQMLKARANRGATGENAIVQTVQTADIIIGPIAIILPNAMMGELTTRMAEAIAAAKALKLLLPLTQERIDIIGLKPEPLPHLVEQIVNVRLKEILHHV